MIIVLLWITGTAAAQKKSSPLHILRSERAHGLKKDGVDVLITYKAVFQQDNAILSSDSAYFYQKANAFDAFGHVLITQGDTLHIYGDKLNYNGNTKVAIMTDNVRMVDKDATLTTNYLTYSTATKIGTYTGGGKLVNKENTLVSKNGWYFTSNRDAYFRYDVVLTTTDAIIKTDTLKYNSGSRIAYFLGPTNIYGKKDKDTLYTENGTYNTQTEQAFFGKNNMWKQKTKSLKGDSLFYDRLIGYGKAVKHVTFFDSEQKIIMKGDLGEHFKIGERTLMTQHPYVVFITEEKVDSTKKDSATVKPVPATNKKPTFTAPKNSMPIVDPAQLNAQLKTIKNVVPLPISDSLQSKAIKAAKTINPKTAAAVMDSVQSKLNKKDKNNKPAVAKALAPITKDTSHIKRDSIFMTADTIETQILTYKDLKALKEVRRIAAERARDTSIKNIPSIVYKKPVKHLDIVPLSIPPDTTVFHRNYFKNVVVKKDTTQLKLAAKPVKKPARAAPKNIVVGIDSVNLTQTVDLSDTARVRILTAAHHAKIFKSDLQAKADSIFFSYSDSVARMYVHPMIWVQGSQLSADTINLQMKHKQLDNLEMYPSSFIVNIEKGDSTHFNQVGGKKMRGFFRNSKLYRMFVFANAETIYFARDSLKVTEMHRTISSKISVGFKNNEPLDIKWFVKPDARYTAIAKVKDDDKVLKGFLWKPQDRPVSKESIIPSESNVPSKKTNGKKVPDKKASAKPGAIPTVKPVLKTGSDSLKVKTDTLQRFKLKADSIKTKKDSVKIKKDTVKIK
ncbi:OstA family protein [Mucilaginibacter paludis DSM 18603]|uniref:OstA family protein n=1 Tax=Mucilaginibacter paludis DSM 18603 TaxID=714943 RepID=H1Y4A5_9SPHI|nr:OstA family protein [Mucilaginibacter paludis DSM 18603]